MPFALRLFMFASSVLILFSVMFAAAQPGGFTTSQAVTVTFALFFGIGSLLYSVVARD